MVPALSLNPQQGSSYTQRESPHGVRTGRCQCSFPSQGQAGSGSLHSELLDKSALSWAPSIPFILHLSSGHLGCPQQMVVSGGCRGTGEGALPEPPAWEVPPKALCSCKADCNFLESFFYPLLNSLSLIISSNAQILHHGISIELLLPIRIHLYPQFWSKLVKICSSNSIFYG